MILNISVYSKNATDLNNFKIFFLDNKITSKLNLVASTSSKKVKNSKFSLLKSPHVNKTSQEQFKYCIYCKQLLLFSSQVLLLLLYIKTFKEKICSNLHIKINIKSNHFNNKLSNCINPSKLSLDNENKAVNNYLNFLDSFGEVSFRR